jgi:hypothetical protein
MNTTELLSQIEAEISRLNQVRALLAGTSNGVHRTAPPAKKRTWTMSAEAREKIAAAQRKRWAKQKRAAK